MIMFCISSDAFTSGDDEGPPLVTLRGGFPVNLSGLSILADPAPPPDAPRPEGAGEAFSLLSIVDPGLGSELRTLGRFSGTLLNMEG